MASYFILVKHFLYWVEFRIRCGLGLYTTKSDSSLLLLTQFHNEKDELPGFIRNVSPHVDSMIGLDDGSTDGSASLFSASSKPVRLIQKSVETPHVWNEPENKRLLINAAKEHLPCWVLVMDADERLEKNFRKRANLAIHLAIRYGFSAISLKLGELWNDRDVMRADGIWGRKERVRLFRLEPDHQVPEGQLHAAWHSVKQSGWTKTAKADLWFYHLGMLTPEIREERKNRYKTLDPESKYQAIGYDYLTDETGIKLRRIKPWRRYVD